MIELKEIVYRYDQQEVLKKVSFRIEPHTIVGLLGLSGSGKTTLMKILSGLSPMASGLYTIEGRAVYNLSKRNPDVIQDVGVVFQDYQLFMHMSVLDNVALPYQLKRKLTPAVARQRARELLESLGLADQLKKYPNQCSGGQQQRIAIARALILEPRILLIDEPTSALDQATTQKVIELLKALNQEGLTILVITHDVYFAQALCQRVVELADGEVIQDTSAKEYFKNRP